jgi:hypothetical protein
LKKTFHGVLTPLDKDLKLYGIHEFYRALKGGEREIPLICTMKAGD